MGDQIQFIEKTGVSMLLGRVGNTDKQVVILDIFYRIQKKLDKPAHSSAWKDKILSDTKAGFQ